MVPAPCTDRKQAQAPATDRVPPPTLAHHGSTHPHLPAGQAQSLDPQTQPPGTALMGPLHHPLPEPCGPTEPLTGPGVSQTTTLLTSALSRPYNGETEAQRVTLQNAAVQGSEAT